MTTGAIHGAKAGASHSTTGTVTLRIASRLNRAANMWVTACEERHQQPVPEKDKNLPAVFLAGLDCEAVATFSCWEPFPPLRLSSLMMAV